MELLAWLRTDTWQGAELHLGLSVPLVEINMEELVPAFSHPQSRIGSVDLVITEKYPITRAGCLFSCSLPLHALPG